MKARLIGLVAIAVGIGMAWFFGLHPLEQAQMHAERVEFHMKAFIVAPMALLMGVFLLVGGTPVLESFSGPPRTARDHLLVWPMFIAALAAGGLAYWWLNAQIHALGYVTGG